MFTSPEQFAAATRTLFELQMNTFNALASKTVQGVEQVVNLNMTTARNMVDSSIAGSREISQASTPQQAAPKPVEAPPAPPPPQPAPPPPAPAPAPAPREADIALQQEKERKEQEKAKQEAEAERQRKLAAEKREAEKLEKELGKLHEQLGEVETRLGDSGVYEAARKDELRELLAEQSRLKAREGDLEERWMAALEHLESLEQQLAQAE